MSNTDPTPALLPPARLAYAAKLADEMDERAWAGKVRPGNGADADVPQLTKMVRDLLRHLDALTPRDTSPHALGKLYRDLRWQADGDIPHVEERVAIEMYKHGHAAALASLQAPAVEDGGEALGRLLYCAMFEYADPRALDTIQAGRRIPYVRGATALHAHGYARGVAAGSETTRHLIEQRNLAQRTAEDAHREIARLTAELAEARAAHAEEIEAWQEASGADTPDELRSLLDGDLARTGVEIDTARLDGAREERRLLALYLDELDPGRARNGLCNYVREWMAERDGDTEGRQGS